MMPFRILIHRILFLSARMRFENIGDAVSGGQLKKRDAQPAADRTALQPVLAQFVVWTDHVPRHRQAKTPRLE